MKVLVVCSQHQVHRQTFVSEQIADLVRLGVAVEVFPIRGKGLRGYLKSVPVLHRTLRAARYDLVHAHYGLSGAVAVLQRRLPVVVTFHGSDIHQGWVNAISTLVSRAAAWCLFVSPALHRQMLRPPSKRYGILPCGVNTDVFYPIEKEEARRRLGLNPGGRYVLFPASFSNEVKNFALAKDALAKLPGVEVLELAGYSREEVNLLMNACDLLLMTSLSEGSPQVIKEAMACNCPIVSTNVGDVKEVTEGTEGCYVTAFDASEIAQRVAHVLARDARTDGRARIEHLSGARIARQVCRVYETVLGVFDAAKRIEKHIETGSLG